MFNGKPEKQRFFSVNYNTYIGDVYCVPQVCYKLGRDIVKTVEEMVEKNLAVIYDEEVRFVSGIPMKLKNSRRDIPVVAKISSIKKEAPEVKPVFSSRRKGKREFS